MDLPILLTVSLLYSPPVAALVGFVSALDPREWRREVTPLHAIFNRSQIALSIFLASVVFHAVAGTISTDPSAIAGTGAALAVDVGANLIFVGAYLTLSNGGDLQATIRRLHVSNAAQLAGIHLGYGALALVLALLFKDVGVWSVALLLVPVLAARQLLLRTQQLQDATEELRARERLLARSFERIMEERRDERFRIASELHDEVLQDLTHVWLLAKGLRTSTSLGQHAATDVGALIASTERSMLALRHVMSDLRKSPLGRGGLVPALRRTALDLQLDWQTPISVHETLDRPIAPDAQLALYQVAREAMLNSLKHGHASRISVEIEQIEGDVRLEVRDDGAGFNVAGDVGSEHLGLTLMRERVARAGGTIEILSAEQQGTAVVAAVPGEPDSNNS